MQAKTFTILFCSLFISGVAMAQVPGTTSEDSLSNSLSKSGTSIGGYGDAFYQKNQFLGTSRVDLERFVLFVGHKFNEKVSFFSELEVEDAKELGYITAEVLAIEDDINQRIINATKDYAHLNDTAKEERLNEIADSYYRQKYLLRIKESLNTFASRF